MKFGRRDADNREGISVHLNDAADDASIIVKTGVPIGIREHDVRSAVRAILIGRVDQTAEIGLKPQSVKVISSDQLDPGAGWISAGIKTCYGRVIGDELIEAAVAIAQVAVVWEGLIAGFVLTAHDLIEVLGLRNIQRVQDQRVHHAEDDGVCADSQRERCDRNDCESGRFTQHAEAEAYILQEIFEPLQAVPGSVVFFYRFSAAKFQDGLASRFDG